MHVSKLVKAASIGVLSLGLTALPFSISASAQEATDPNQTVPEAVEDTVEDIEFDWGWLGLLGLIGLAGLAGRKRDDASDRYRSEVRTDVNASYRTDAPTGHRADVPRTDASRTDVARTDIPRSNVPRYRDPNATNYPE